MRINIKDVRNGVSWYMIESTMQSSKIPYVFQITVTQSKVLEHLDSK